MTADWTFLEPWLAVLFAITKTGQTIGTGMNVSIRWPYLHPDLQLYVHLHLEDGNSQHVIELKQIREAIELFTALSLTNNKVFREQFPDFTEIMDQGDENWYPRWDLDVSGSLTAQNGAWSTLLGDLEPSPQFQRAIQLIKAVSVEETVILQLPGCPVMEWNCESNGVNIEAAITLDEGDTDARTLFDTGVLMLAHLTLPPHLSDLNTPFYQVLAAGLVRTPINYLIINFDEEMPNDAQDTMDVGVLVKRTYQWAQVVSERIDITCYNKVSQNLFAAICSAISVGSTATSFKIYLNSVSTESWPWIVYALSCSPSPDISLTIYDTVLIQSDLPRIADVLRCNYPHSKESTSAIASFFGFVDIMEGTVVDVEGSPFTVPNSVRCRTWFKEDNTIEVVIPGVGLCRSRIGDGVSVVSRGIEEQKALKLSALRKLHVAFTPIESVSVVTNLLELIGGNLRSLALRISPENSDRALDLSVLSAVCPNLESLTTYVFDVVVSIHNEALRLWPIKQLTITDSRKLTDIPVCLRNASLRMARELEELIVNVFEQEVDEREARDVRALDGDFLSVVKEPLPIQSKAAMASVINSVHYSKAVHRLHADVLRTIFVLASTPAQRSVYFWTNYTEFSHFLARRRQ